MSNAAVIGVSLALCLYVVTSLGYYFSGRIGMATVFGGYVIGNLGFLLDYYGY